MSQKSLISPERFNPGTRTVLAVAGAVPAGSSTHVGALGDFSPGALDDAEMYQKAEVVIPSIEECLKAIQTHYEDRELWELAAALLPPRCPVVEYYTIRDVMAVAGTMKREDQLSRHAHEIWPNHEGNYRMKYDKACQLLRRYYFVGRLPHSREYLELKLAEKLQKKVERRRALAARQPADLLTI